MPALRAQLALDPKHINWQPATMSGQSPGQLEDVLMSLTAVCAIGQVQQSAISATAEEYEDKDGDVLMAEEDIEQLVASLQAARHASSEWENMGGLSSISMLLFGHQVKILHPFQRPRCPMLLLHLHSELSHCMPDKQVRCLMSTNAHWCMDQSHLLNLGL